MNLLHNATGHFADSTTLEALPVWYNLPAWLTLPLHQAFLRSAHCLICELCRRQQEHPVGSEIPSQIAGHTLRPLLIGERKRKRSKKWIF